jgi:hypothetical protein
MHFSLGYPCPENHNPADFFIQTLAVRPGDEETSRYRIRKICDAFSRATDAIERQKRGNKRARKEVLALDDDDPRDYDFQAKGGEETGSGDGLPGYIRRGHGLGSSSPYRVPWTVQTRALLWRSWLTMVREPIIIKVRVLETIVSDNPASYFDCGHEHVIQFSHFRTSSDNYEPRFIFLAAEINFSVGDENMQNGRAAVRNILQTFGSV